MKKNKPRGKFNCCEHDAAGVQGWAVWLTDVNRYLNLVRTNKLNMLTSLNQKVSGRMPGCVLLAQERSATGEKAEPNLPVLPGRNTVSPNRRLECALLRASEQADRKER
ncbi:MULTISPECIES: hypothetical protein [Ralstonia solanacearum species complex]|uniref:hypothetical protein n=1 Tax=Ralstonia solanacearum species complex TaxID=3116862 RepID=UPI0013A6309E|nr:hypothetical protein [Ralstonia solanacearum]QOK80927.1 hypothetical protein HF906_01275 [Ralstonia solanacearum]